MQTMSNKKQKHSKALSVNEVTLCSSTGKNISQKDKHALVVEDDILSAEVLTSLLNSLNITATVINSPEKMERVVNDLEQLDIIFLDIAFPKYDGIEVYQKIKDNARIQSIPIVGYSSHIGEIKRARRAGLDGFLGKPLRQDRFADQLNDILNGKPIWDSGLGRF